MFDPSYVLWVLNQEAKSCRSFVSGDDTTGACKPDGSFECNGWKVRPYNIGGSAGVFITKTTESGILYRRAHRICTGTIMLGQEDSHPKVVVDRAPVLDAVAPLGIHGVKATSPNTEYKVSWHTYADDKQDYSVLVTNGGLDVRYLSSERSIVYEVRDASWAVMAHFAQRADGDVVRTVVLYTEEDPSALTGRLEAYLEANQLGSFTDIIDLWPDIYDAATA